MKKLIQGRLLPIILSLLLLVGLVSAGLRRLG